MRHHWMLLLATIGTAGRSTLAPGRLPAQHEHGAAGPGGEVVGRVAFHVSCRPETQPRFERAVALLHSFWYEEADTAFSRIVVTDSLCGMGYWGIAMSALHPLWTPPSAFGAARGLAAAEQAVSLTGGAEREYAEAIATYYRDYATVDHRIRLLAYGRAMQGIVRRHPADDEARAFYALALIANGQLDTRDTTLARQRRAGAILEALFQRHPDHPGLAHYLIHAYDSPALAARATLAADRYARIAPSVPHALHMPSHIYTRLGRWDASIAANRRSVDAARRYEAAQHPGAMWDQRAHALDYLAYAYLQLGRDSAAREVVAEAAAAKEVFPPGSLTTDYALAAIPARYVLERGRWADAAALTVRPAPSWRAAEAITHFARALGAARTAQPDAAAAEVDTLAMIERILADEGGAQGYWSVQVKIQRMAAEAWVALARGDTARAIDEAAAAADLEDRTALHPVTPGPVLPARELDGDLLLAIRRPAAAERAYQRSLVRQPNRARSLAGLAAARRAATAP
jgi:tetratricopeptide (TPR) repeat protein